MNKQHKRPTVVSLYSGAGGLDIGLEAAGFQTKLCVEIDSIARKTLFYNRPNWKLAIPGDIHAHNPHSLVELANLKVGELDLLAGGPPCQPFSKSSYWVAGDSKRLDDPRSKTLNAYLNFVEAALPRVLLLENVRGLIFDGKDDGLQFLKKGLTKINAKCSVKYTPVVLCLNSADYGVPQIRERIFIIASRDGKEFLPPDVTHGDRSDLLPYKTTWDAIGDLDTVRWPKELSPTGKWAGLLPTIPEGSNYLWHTSDGGGEPLFGWRTKYWSFLLKLSKHRPSWTIQAAPGPATGPFHWRSRLLSTRELCRLQTFPDDYVIHGDRRAAQRQLGNAVPCLLAETIGQQILKQLLGVSFRRIMTLIPRPQKKCPPAEKPKRVSPFYKAMRAVHEAHPGTGLGPRAARRHLEALM